MIFRLLLLSLLVWAIFQVIRIMGKSKEGSTGYKGQAEQMLQCDFCGTHIPAHEAIRVGDKTYCSTRHRDLDKAS